MERTSKGQIIKDAIHSSYSMKMQGFTDWANACKARRITEYIIITHANCSDGEAAAQIMAETCHAICEGSEGLQTRGSIRWFHKDPSMGAIGTDVAEYISGIGNDGYAVVFTDISPQSKDEWLYAEGIAMDMPVLVMDHHKSSIDELAQYQDEIQHVDCWCESGYSSAMQSAIGFLHVIEDICPASRPQVKDFAEGYIYAAAYVQDRDLWRHKLPDTKIINAYLKGSTSERPFYEKFDKLADGKAKDMERILADGNLILSVKNDIIKDIVENESSITFFTDEDSELYAYPILMALAPRSLSSDTCHELIQRYEASDTALTVSLRRGQENGYNLSVRGKHALVIAKCFGGGGHPEAAGASLDEIQFKRLASKSPHKFGWTLHSKK